MKRRTSVLKWPNRCAVLATALGFSAPAVAQERAPVAGLESDESQYAPEEHKPERPTALRSERRFKQWSVLIGVERLVSVAAVGEASYSGSDLHISVAGFPETTSQGTSPRLGADVFLHDHLTLGFAGFVFLNSGSEGNGSLLSPRVGGYLGNSWIAVWPKVGISWYSYGGEHTYTERVSSLEFDVPVLLRIGSMAAFTIGPNYSRALRGETVYDDYDPAEQWRPWHLGISAGLVIAL